MGIWGLLSLETPDLNGNYRISRFGRNRTKRKGTFLLVPAHFIFLPDARKTNVQSTSLGFDFPTPCRHLERDASARNQSISETHRVRADPSQINTELLQPPLQQGFGFGGTPIHSLCKPSPSPSARGKAPAQGGAGRVNGESRVIAN